MAVSRGRRGAPVHWAVSVVSSSPSTSSSPEAPSAPQRIAAADVAAPSWAVFAITFAAYLMTAHLGLLLAIQPGNASPLFPAAGVGLAAAFVWGRWAVVAHDVPWPQQWAAMMLVRQSSVQWCAVTAPQTLL